MKYRTFCEEFIAALGAGDWPAMEKMLHPDFEVLEAEGLPYGGTYRGFEGWRRLSDKVLSTWSGFRIKLMEMHGGDDDYAIVRFAMSGRSRKTGTAWDTTVLELWNFRNGLLARIDPYYFDTHLLARADSE
jgi:ketosteroid isomerase-like protein